MPTIRDMSIESLVEALHGTEQNVGKDSDGARIFRRELALRDELVRQYEKRRRRGADGEKQYWSVACLQLSTRAIRCLERERIYRLRDLLNMTQETLLRRRGIGSATVDEIKERLSELGLALALANADIPQQCPHCGEPI